MPRYRTLNNDAQINVDRVALLADADGAFTVASGSRAEAVLIAGGAVRVDAQPLFPDSVSGGGFTDIEPTLRANAEAYSQALIAAPARPVSAAALVGVAYRLTDGTLLLCSVAGTTGATDPTLVDGVITDGTASFYQLGRKSNIASGLDVPTITSSQTAPGGTSIRSFTIGGSNYALPAYGDLDNTGTSLRAVLFNAGNSTDYGLGATGRVPAVTQWSFMSDAPLLAVAFDNFNNRYFIEVDGHLIEESPTALVGPAVPSYYIINWGGKRKMRRYVVNINGNVPIRGVLVAAADTLQAAPIGAVPLLWFGDSYATSEVPNLTNVSVLFGPTGGIGNRVSRLLGADYCVMSNMGGTGYALVTGSPSIKWVCQNTLYPNVAKGRGVVIYAGGYNDYINSVSVASTVLAAQEAWAAGLSKYPLSKHVVIGPWPGRTGPSAACLALDAAMSTAAEAMGLDYLSPAADPAGAWITGTGRVGTTTGTGNSDFYTSTDGTHASPQGNEYYAQRIAREVLALISRRKLA